MPSARTPTPRLGGEHRALRRRDVGAGAPAPCSARAAGTCGGAPDQLGLDEAEAARRFADENGERMLELGAAAVEAERLRFSGGDFGLHAGQVELGRRRPPGSGAPVRCSVSR